MEVEQKKRKELPDRIGDPDECLAAAGETPQEDPYIIPALGAQIGSYIIQDGKFKFINSRFRDFAGYSEEEMLCMEPSSLILPEDRRKTAKNTLSMLNGRRRAPYEFQMKTKDGQTKWIMETVMPIDYKGKRALLGNAMDVTEHKAAARRLEELEALESSILDAIPQAVIGLHERRINFANYAVKTVFGWESQELIGKNIGIVYRNKKEADEIGKIFYSTLKRQRTYETEFPCVRKDGAEMMCRMKASRIGERLSRKRIVVTFEDITAQKKARQELERSREELRSLSAHLQTVREEERTRVARKIHDELGQSLTALQMDLSWLSSRLPPEGGGLHEKTRSMSGLVNDTLQSVHDISAELRPSLLDDLGLPAAIEWQVRDFEKRFNIKCTVRMACSGGLERDLATAVFRILQETLTNVARHSKATRCKVQLKKNEKELRLQITDNGVGINPQQMEDPGSFGIIGMRERAHLWGGVVKVGSAKPSGTMVSVSIPLAKEKLSR